ERAVFGLEDNELPFAGKRVRIQRGVRRGRCRVRQIRRIVAAGVVGDTGAAQPAIAVGIAAQVVLVFGFGAVVVAKCGDLGADLAMAGLPQRRLVHLASGQCDLLLRRVGVVNGAAVVAADVVALAVAL